MPDPGYLIRTIKSPLDPKQCYIILDDKPRVWYHCFCGENLFKYSVDRDVYTCMNCEREQAVEFIMYVINPPGGPRIQELYFTPPSASTQQSDQQTDQDS